MAKISLTSERQSLPKPREVFWAPRAVWVDAEMGVPVLGTGLADCAPRAAPWGTEQGCLCPTSQDLPTFICTSPAGCELSKSKKTLRINLAIPGSFLCAFSPQGSSHTLLLQGNHFLLYSYWKKSVLLLSSSTDPSWHHSNESDVKSELCHVPPHCVKDYAVQKPVATQ